MNINNLTWVSIISHEYQSSHMSINNLMYFVLCRINHRDSKCCNNRLYNLPTIDVRLYLFLVHLVERVMWEDWYSCEMIDSHVRLLILMWDDWHSCVMIDTHVILLILMWDYWYSCEMINTHVSFFQHRTEETSEPLHNTKYVRVFVLL